MGNRNWVKLQDFQNDNKDLLIIIACPKEDTVSISYGGLNGFVKFPQPESLDKGVIFNALRASKFNEAIEPLMAGLIKGAGFDLKNRGANELLKTVGGGISSIGREKLKVKK